MKKFWVKLQTSKHQHSAWSHAQTLSSHARKWVWWHNQKRLRWPKKVNKITVALIKLHGQQQSLLHVPWLSCTTIHTIPLWDSVWDGSVCCACVWGRYQTSLLILCTTLYLLVQSKLCLSNSDQCTILHLQYLCKSNNVGWFLFLAWEREVWACDHIWSQCNCKLANTTVVTSNSLLSAIVNCE